jgi:hypothetical protein
VYVRITCYGLKRIIAILKFNPIQMAGWIRYSVGYALRPNQVKARNVF